MVNSSTSAGAPGTLATTPRAVVVMPALLSIVLVVTASTARVWPARIVPQGAARIKDKRRASARFSRDAREASLETRARSFK
jgi:hypothetical protein